MLPANVHPNKPITNIDIYWCQCDVCGLIVDEWWDARLIKAARFDSFGKVIVTLGNWTFMCRECFKQHGYNQPGFAFYYKSQGGCYVL